MLPRHLARSLGAVALALLSPGTRSGAQPLLIPNQMAKSLTVELHSVADDVRIVSGDPQVLFAIELRPFESEPPRIDFSNFAQTATLRVLDLSLLEAERPAGDEGEEQDEEAPPEEPAAPQPVAQTWNIKLMPPAPTTFLLQCDGRGKGFFDFTDMQVREVHLIGDTTALSLRFGRPNPVSLERLKVTARAGKLEIHGLLNAWPRLATLQLQGAACDVDLDGRPFTGEAEIFFEGVPAALRISLRRGVAVRIDGPAAAVTRFDRSGLERQGLALASPNYNAAACRLHLYFSQAIPGLEVRWLE